MAGYAVSRPLQRSVMHGKKSSKSVSPQRAAEIAARQKAEGIILKGAHQAAKYAARSQMKGAAGAALRIGGRVGLRAIPIVGAAMLAYDLYQFGSWLLEDD